MDAPESCCTNLMISLFHSTNVYGMSILWLSEIVLGGAHTSDKKSFFCLHGTYNHKGEMIVSPPIDKLTSCLQKGNSNWWLNVIKN